MTSEINKPFEVKEARLIERLEAKFEEGARMERLIRQKLRRIAL